MTRDEANKMMAEWVQHTVASGILRSLADGEWGEVADNLQQAPVGVRSGDWLHSIRNDVNRDAAEESGINGWTERAQRLSDASEQLFQCARALCGYAEGHAALLHDGVRELLVAHAQSAADAGLFNGGRLIVGELSGEQAAAAREAADAADARDAHG